MQRLDTDRVRERELALVPAVEVHTLIDGNITRHPETHFLDFVVDGRSIREMVGVGPGHVTQLCRTWLHTVPQSVDRLLGRVGTDRLPENRVALLVCGTAWSQNSGGSGHLEVDAPSAEDAAVNVRVFHDDGGCDGVKMKTPFGAHPVAVIEGWP